jgi:hypothetical protein
VWQGRFRLLSEDYQIIRTSSRRTRWFVQLHEVQLCRWPEQRCECRNDSLTRGVALQHFPILFVLEQFVAADTDHQKRI